MNIGKEAGVGEYLQEIARYPLLSKDQEIMLSRVIQEWQTAEDPTPTQVKKGLRARDKMIKSNLRLVVSIAKRYSNRAKRMAFLDLVQEGNIGLTIAVERFDPYRGYRFSTYSYWWIRQAISRGIQQQDRTIKLPANAQELLNKVRFWSMDYEREHGKRPSMQQCADAFDIRLERLRGYLAHDHDCDSLNRAASTARMEDSSELLHFIAGMRLTRLINFQKMFLPIASSVWSKNYRTMRGLLLNRYTRWSRMKIRSLLFKLVRSWGIPRACQATSHDCHQ